MTPHDLIAAFEVLADAPEGVARLRELVLQLAVRGKLVPQDPQDEPANVLVERIAIEKARLSRERRVQKEKPLPALSEDEVPFDVPAGWQWVRLTELFPKITDGTHHSPPNLVAGTYKYVTAKNIKEHGVDLGNISFVSERVHKEIFSRCDPEAGDILIVKDGATTGVVTVNDVVEPFSLLSSVGLLKTFGLINSWYGCYAMRSPFFYGQIRGEMAGIAITRVTLTKLNAAILPLPPVAEQHRIVARVDELMGLLDRLDAAKNTREGTRAALRDSALATLRNANSPDQVEAAWQRIAERMDDLFTAPPDVDSLRQAVLQLAVRGSLVSQDPDDEPASVLLERIASEKARLVREGTIRASKPIRPVSKEKVPFELPDSWALVPFGEVFASVFTGPFGTSLKKSEYQTGGTPVINPQNLHEGRIEATPDTCVGPATLKRLSGFRLAPRDLVVARRGEMGRCAVVGDREGGWLCGTGSLILRPPSALCTEFAAMYLRSPWTVTRLSGDSVGATMSNLNQRIMLNLPFGLPPLAEQHRIVARVDELMSLLDRLEQHLVAKDATHAALAAAAVHHLDA